MSRNWKIKFCLIIIMMFFITSSPVFAQSLDNKVVLQVSPVIPGAYQNTTVSLTSIAVDLRKANITWTVDGKPSDSGVGKDSLSVKTGAVGTSTKIFVSIMLSTGERIDKIIVINPSEIDILWQAIDSYVPPFYKGKALPASESDIRVVAMPNIRVAGNKLKSSDLVYTWKRNYEADQSGSGYSKSSFTFTQSYFNDIENISVEASAVSQNYAAKKSVVIKTYPPRIIFYESRPLFGNLYEKAINNGLYISNSETGIVAEPYFFSPKDINNKNLRFVWNINGQNIPEPSQKNKILVAPAEGGSKTSNLGLTVENLGKLFQTRTQGFEITSN